MNGPPNEKAQGWRAKGVLFESRNDKRRLSGNAQNTSPRTVARSLETAFSSPLQKAERRLLRGFRRDIAKTARQAYGGSVTALVLSAMDQLKLRGAIVLVGHLPPASDAPWHHPIPLWVLSSGGAP